MVSNKYLEGEATVLPFFLDFEGEGLECLGDEGVTICEDSWSIGLFGDPTMLDVTTNGEAGHLL